MTESNEVRKVPVVAYVTFKSFFSRVGTTIPGRIDRGVLKYTSGAIQSQLIHAFRALGLTDDQGHPNRDMEALALAYANNDKAALAALLRGAYPAVLDGKFNLARGTHAQLREKFEAMGGSGDSIRKAMAFFVAAAKDAGIEVSPYITGTKVRTATGSSNGQAKTKGRPRKRPKEPKVAESAGKGTPAQTSADAFWKSVLDKLPAFDPTWSKEAQQDWIGMLERITKQKAGEK